MTTTPNTPEPAPKPTDEIPVWQWVIENADVLGDVASIGARKMLADMAERDRQGRAKYGTPLQASNGRDHAVDAYQEALDLVVYCAAARLRLASEGKLVEARAWSIRCSVAFSMAAGIRAEIERAETRARPSIFTTGGAE